MLTDNRFCVARLRGNDTHIIKPFDTLDDAIAYAQSLMDDWDYFGGLPCVTVRHPRKNFSEDDRKWGLKPYTEDIVWCNFDIEKLDEADRIRATRKNNRRKKRRKQELREKEESNGNLETNQGI